jgi:hypothetical protein
MMDFKDTSGQIYLNNIPGKYDIKELQKTAILGTAHVFQKVLMQQYKMLIKRHNVHAPYIVATEQLQHHVL